MVSNLSLSELIELKETLRGTDSVRGIDNLIYQLSDISFETCNQFNRRDKQRNKEIYLKKKKFNRYKRI